MIRCFMCGQEFQFGPHAYKGKHIARYNISVCEPCYDSNWDGWAPHYESRLIKYIESQGIPVPMRNEKGLIPRE